MRFVACHWEYENFVRTAMIFFQKMKIKWFKKYLSTAWKVSKYGVISGPYFFNPNTGKHGSEITPYFDTFHAVFVLWIANMLFNVLSYIFTWYSTNVSKFECFEELKYWLNYQTIFLGILDNKYRDAYSSLNKCLKIEFLSERISLCTFKI